MRRSAGFNPDESVTIPPSPDMTVCKAYVTLYGATFVLYLNVFVLVVRLFLKGPVLHALAPTGTEHPFLAVQGLGAWHRARSGPFMPFACGW